MPPADHDLSHPFLRPLRAERARQGRDDGIALIDPLGIAEPTFVPTPLLAIVRRFDGAQDVAAIAAAASEELGERVDAEFVLGLAQQLDERLLLETASFAAARTALVRQFVRAPARPSRHAGSAGYPSDPQQLRAALTAMVPEPTQTATPLRGLIAPHIDLDRGHAGYAAAYGRLLAAPPADLYVIFGTGHQGPMAAVTGLPIDWDTPLGRARTDRAFIDDVHRAIGPAQEHDLLLHRDEHSLEFQVLMLQHLAERRAQRTGASSAAPFEVACFLCGPLPSRTGDPLREPWCKDLIAAFRSAAERAKKRACFIAGADLAHLGPFFDDAAPVDRALLTRLDRDERARLQLLQEGKPGAFHQAIDGCQNPDRVCSAPAITLTSALAGGHGELLHYGQAAAEDGSQVVSFCAMAFAG